MSYVLSSISGNLISAVSAGFAPTNSADISAIASAYQVVSSTATQLNAGTAYLTSVNDAPISAARAGNAANASMANSAYYDGTGRLISALPDEAAVSAIASAYAESAASSKQDTLTFGYDAEDKISSIDGSALAGDVGVDSATVSAIASSYAESAASSKVDISSNDNIQISAKGLAISGGSITARYGNNMAVLQTSPIQRMYLSDLGSDKRVDIYKSGISGNDGGIWQYGTAEYGNLTSVYGTVSTNSATWGGGIDSATCSAIASAYAESAASSKQDALTFGYNAENKISSIDGSALAGGGGGVDSATCSAIASAYAESAVSSVSGNYALSSDVSATVDLVGTQSANWGGSALALSAGSGVKLEKVGDTLVASTDETVLWSGSGSAFTTTEPLTNFSEIKFYVKSHASANVGEAVVPMVNNNRTAIKLSWADDWNKGAEWLGGLQWWASLSNTGMTSFVVSNSYYIGLMSGVTYAGGGSYGTNIYVLDVIGVGRTAGV